MLSVASIISSVTSIISSATSVMSSATSITLIFTRWSMNTRTNLFPVINHVICQAACTNSQKHLVKSASECPRSSAQWPLWAPLACDILTASVVPEDSQIGRSRRVRDPVTMGDGQVERTRTLPIFLRPPWHCAPVHYRNGASKESDSPSPNFHMILRRSAGERHLEVPRC
jgi:hypothetical protein